MDQSYFFGEILLTVHIRNRAKQKQNHCLDLVMRLAPVQCSTYKGMAKHGYAASQCIFSGSEFQSDAAIQKIIVLIQCMLFSEQIIFAMYVFRYPRIQMLICDNFKYSLLVDTVQD